MLWWRCSRWAGGGRSKKDINVSREHRVREREAVTHPIFLGVHQEKRETDKLTDWKRPETQQRLYSETSRFKREGYMTKRIWQYQEDGERERNSVTSYGRDSSVLFSEGLKKKEEKMLFRIPLKMPMFYVWMLLLSRIQTGSWFCSSIMYCRLLYMFSFELHRLLRFIHSCLYLRLLLLCRTLFLEDINWRLTINVILTWPKLSYKSDIEQEVEESCFLSVVVNVFQPPIVIL